jgi:MoaA/NifB/PqqE/SkfB family radical SAM enzyme
MYFEATLKDKALKFFRLVSRRYAFPPRDITIEVSTNCGQGCAVCFRKPLGVSAADMDLGLFLKVLGAIASAYSGGQPKYLNFVGLGEPFCNPELGRMLRLARETFPGACLNVSTSLSVLDRAAFAALVEEGIINRLSVSLDSFEPGGSFHPFSETLMQNFIFLKELKPRGKNFKVRVQTLITSAERVASVINFASVMAVDEIQLMRVDLHAFGGKAPVSRPPLEEERAIVRSAMALAARRGLRCRNNNIYNPFMDIASALDKFCLTTDDHVFIDAEGNALPCFYLRKVKLGNLAVQTLAEITKKKRAMDFYGRQAELCRGCDIYKKEHCAGEDA